MAHVNYAAYIATENKTNDSSSSVKEKGSITQGSDEIIIRIKNGSVISFVKNVHFSALEGLNGDGI
ncbi:hypothetical protein [Pelosinus sp. IPA-1]|uniref:hypothetical protein n=1 Tax=Pelosinus sp. IPA-1 TaxID=3029569 RepID=UPI0024361A70|nr:hypothetical protein [Pelosinus sp. IPA-1]GMA97858.1 hypothetical protein PIPA1_06580 [Pelosinus sp. IPA-1]